MGPAYWILTTAVLVSMATLIITLNHLSHKEYSEEIDRLRHDLLADRTADHQSARATQDDDRRPALVAQLVTQRQEVALLEQVLAKKEELCRQMSESLDECSLRLQQTSVQRHRTETSPSWGHPEAETSYRLHDKLAHKRSVQDDSRQVGRQFRLAFNQKLVDMEDSLSEFIQEEAKFSLAFKKNLGDNLHRRSLELSAVSEQVASLVDSQAQTMQDMEKRSTDQASQSQQWIQELLSVARSTGDSEVNSLHNFLTDSFLPVVQSLQRQILVHKSEIQGLNRQLNEQLQQHLESVQTFAAAQGDALAQLRDTVLQQVLQQQQQLDRARDIGRGLIRSERTFNKELASQLEQASMRIQVAQNMWESHRVETNQSLNDLDGGLHVAADSSDKLLQVTNAGLDSQTKRITELRSSCETQAEELLESVSGFLERGTANMAGAERFRNDLEVEVRNSIAGNEAAWREQYRRTEQDLRKLSESLREEQQNQQEHRQVLVSALRESAETHEATLEQQRLDFSKFVRDRQDDLESQCSYVADWSHAMTSELRQRDQDVEEFLSRALCRETFKGNPSQRREYLRLLGANFVSEHVRSDRFPAMNDAGGSLVTSSHEVSSTVSSRQSSSTDVTGTAHPQTKMIPTNNHPGLVAPTSSPIIIKEKTRVTNLMTESKTRINKKLQRKTELESTKKVKPTSHKA